MSGPSEKTPVGALSQGEETAYDLFSAVVG